MLKTNDLLNNYVFALQNPDYIKQLIVKYCLDKGIKINQDKTLAPFTAFVNSVAVAQTAIQMNFPDGTFGATSGGVAGSTYPDSEHFLIVGIKVYQGVAASLNQTPWLQGITDPLLLAGRMTINNNGTQVGKDTPLTRFPNSATNADLDGGYIQLDTPIFWVGQTSLFVGLIFPTATAVANQNIRVELIGLKLI
jgi:hypothetical protein